MPGITLMTLQHVEMMTLLLCLQRQRLPIVEKRIWVPPAAWEALTMAEFAARWNGMGDKTINEAVKGKPKNMSKKVAK